MSAWNEGDREYAANHAIPELFEKLAHEVLEKKPKKPIEWLRSRLNESDFKDFDAGEVRKTAAVDWSRGTALNNEERDALNLQGLLPFSVETLDEQVARCEAQLNYHSSPLGKFIFLNLLRERNPTLFYKVILKNLQTCLPLIYTPVVGEACQKFSEIYRIPQGMYVNLNHKGRVRQVLDNWTHDVDIIVVTDGSRILGLGDLGCNGMGIPIGKLSLYITAAGFHPSRALPVTIDVGTDNQALLTDPLYLGMKQQRCNDEEFYALMQEFLTAVKEKWPECLVQFEDFSNNHCFQLLEMYRSKLRCFNDDIQGTGAVIAAGFWNASKISGTPLSKQKVVFVGAGSAAVGVADTIALLMSKKEDISIEEARKCFYLVDSQGLVLSNRGELPSHKVPWARTDVTEPITGLFNIVKAVQPTALIGLSGQPGIISDEVLKEMANINQRPIIFALSNPTSKSECTAEAAYKATSGKCLFASGSPFPPVELDGKTFVPGQGNNMYIFPGLGFGAWLCKAREVSDAMVIESAVALAEQVGDDLLQQGTMYPPLNNIREISVVIASRVMKQAASEVLCGSLPDNLMQYVKENMWVPEYK